MHSIHAGSLAEEIEILRSRGYSEGRLIPDPVKPKAEDFVITTGSHLRRLLKDLRILRLFCGGFATNVCVMSKDCGVEAMSGTGYNVILFGDCATGIETIYTIRDLSATKTAIQQTETHHSSTTSEDFINACKTSLVKDQNQTGVS